MDFVLLVNLKKQFISRAKFNIEYYHCNSVLLHLVVVEKHLIWYGGEVPHFALFGHLYEFNEWKKSQKIHLKI